MPKIIDNETRKEFLSFYKDNQSLSSQQLANAFERSSGKYLSATFIRKFVKEYKEKGEYPKFDAKARGYPLICDDTLDILKDLATQNKGASTEQLRALFKEETGVSVSLSTLRQSLEKNGLSLRKEDQLPWIKHLPPDYFVGKKYSLWTVIGEVEPDDKDYVGVLSNLLCQCECGFVQPVQINKLTRGMSKGCRSCSLKAYYQKKRKGA